MNEFEVKAKEYWDERYRREGQIWGQGVSRAAWIAIQLFGQNNAKKILVPGSGYGRHTALLAESGFEVTGVEISAEAVKLAREYDKRSRFIEGSALDLSFSTEKYDAVFCFNLLHLFLENERTALIAECAQNLKRPGLMFFTVFSEKEEDNGKGTEVEKNTFETRPGRPAHYFSDADLAAHFALYSTVEMGLVEDAEDHGGRAHTHILRYICVQT